MSDATDSPSPIQQDEPVPRVMADMVPFLNRWVAGSITNIPTPPPTLYHYTDIAALMNIVRLRQLWATNAVFLNDSTELLHSLLMAKRIILESGSGGDSASETTDADALMLRVIDNFYQYVEVYLVCFCLSGDLLSQWRGYGHIAGYAMGLDPLALPTGGRLTLLPVMYDEAVQEHRLRDLVIDWRKTFRDVSPRNVDIRPWNAGELVFAESFSAIAVGFKSSAFAEEQEWRLAYRRSRIVPDDGLDLTVSFRDRDGMILPYTAVECSIAGDEGPPRLPLREIVVGPTRYPPTAGYAVQQFLTAHHYPSGSVPVRLSAVPLRV